MRLRQILQVLLVLLIAVTALLAWRVVRVYLIARSMTVIEGELYPAGALFPDTDALARHLPRLRAAERTFPHDARIGEMLFDALIFEAYLHPAGSVESLRELIPLGRELNAQSYSDPDKTASQLGWVLNYADLPAEITAWYDAMDSASRWDSGQLVFYVILAEAAADNREGALERLEDEMRERSSWFNDDAMAVTVLVALDEDEQAAEWANLAANQGIYMQAFLWGLGEYYLRRSNYVDAEKFFRRYFEQSGRSAEEAFDLAVCLAALRGMPDPEVTELLDLAAQSERNESTRSGLAAALCTRLLELSGDEQWWQRLERLREAQPGDFFVATAIADAAATARHRRYAPLSNESEVGLPYRFALPDPIDAAEAAAGLSESEFQRQTAELALAYACAASCSAGSIDAALLERSVLHLRRALGDPAVSGAVESPQTPQYSAFLTDRHVRSLRGASAEFDLAVNHAVIDYLNRRRELFADLLESGPLEYRDRQALAESGAASTT